MCGEEGEIREIAEPHGIARVQGTRVRRREIGKREMYREAQSGTKGVEALKSRLLVTAFENGTGLLRWDEGFDEHLTESGIAVSTLYPESVYKTHFSSFSLPRTSSTNSGILTTLNSS